jgi:hypothetical protein
METAFSLINQVKEFEKNKEARETTTASSKSTGVQNSEMDESEIGGGKRQSDTDSKFVGELENRGRSSSLEELGAAGKFNYSKIKVKSGKYCGSL